MGSTPLEYCWFIYKIGARTGRLTGQFETYARLFSQAWQLGYRTSYFIAISIRQFAGAKAVGILPQFASFPHGST